MNRKSLFFVLLILFTTFIKGAVSGSPAFHSFPANTSGSPATKKITLHIETADYLAQIAMEKDDDFEQAIKISKQEHKNSQEGLVDIFYSNLLDRKGGDPAQVQLARYFAEKNAQISPESPNELVLTVLREEVDSLEALTYEVIKKRISGLELSGPQPEVKRKSSKILLKLPEEVDSDKILNLVSNPGKFEFMATTSYNGGFNQLMVANQVLQEQRIQDSLANPSQWREEHPEGKLQDFLREYPLFQYFSPTSEVEDIFWPLIGFAYAKDTSAFMAQLNGPEAIKERNPKISFLWSKEPVEGNPNVFALYSFVVPLENQQRLDDRLMRQAKQDFLPGDTDEVVVNIRMTEQGKTALDQYTQNNVGRYLIFTLNGRVLISPKIQQPISGGSFQLTGDFKVEEARYLAILINSGRLPIPVTVSE